MGLNRMTLLPWSMRFFATLQILTGIGFIIYACILESPPTTAIPVGLIIVGILAIVSFFVGFVGSYYKRWCLGVYLMLGTLVTLAELGIVLTLFFNLDGVLSNMETHAYNSLPEAQRASIEAEAKANDEPVSNIWQWDRYGEVKTALEAGRWVFLVVIILQIIGLVVAISMKTCCYRDSDDYEDFEKQQEEAAAARQQQQSTKAQIQMEDLKHSVGNRAVKSASSDTTHTFYASSSKLYKSVTKKMASKYGEFTSEKEFQLGWWQRLWRR